MIKVVLQPDIYLNSEGERNFVKFNLRFISQA